MEIRILCDPLFTTHGPVRPALYVARVMADKQHRVFIVSTRISNKVHRLLKSHNLKPVDLGVKTVTKGGTSLSWFESWAREAFLRLNSRSFETHGDVVVNFSNTLAVPATIWYAQGSTTDFLEDTESLFPKYYKIAYKALKPILGFVDKRLIGHMASMSKLVVANSDFCASMYEKRGVRINQVIHPPLNCQLFKPTSTPSANYVLTYFGKETQFHVVKKIADLGVNVKAFGSKAPYILKELLEHRNVEFVERVSDKKLVDLYSNAMFTLFTFTHEPFGYVPVESMACGTPVLTYNRQGPRETVVNGATGWLVNNSEEIRRLAIKLWTTGYPSHMRTRARERALLYDTERVAEEWLKLIERVLREEKTSSKIGLNDIR